MPRRDRLQQQFIPILKRRPTQEDDMAENISSANQQQFSELVGRVFSDQSFAKALEENPEKALADAGYKLNDEQTKALRAGAGANVTLSDANVAAFVRPVVSVLTKGTRPVVSVVVSSAVVAASAQSREDDR
jgi:hypothetical protein